MTTIIRSDLVISGTYKLTDVTQVATGVKITVLPGATLDLGGFSLLNYGTLSLEGNTNTFAGLHNGTYSTDSTSGVLNSSYGNLESVVVDGFFSNGTLQITNSLVENSSIDALRSNSISKSIFIKSPLDFKIEYGTVDQVTFSDSKVSAFAWPMLDTARLAISNSNFVGTTPVIYLSPFFTGHSHGIVVTGSYIRIPTGSNFETMVYDANDDLKVISDLDASTFLTTPITNNSNGFTVGSYTYPLNLLRGADETAPTLTTFSPSDESTNVPIANNIVLTFSEAIAKGSGSIILKTADGSTVATYNTAASTNLSISGSTLTINPTADLGYSTGYKVELTEGSVKDLAGNNYAGTTSYNFTTLQNLTGTNASESFSSRPGNDIIDGGAGTDVAIFTGNRADYTQTKTTTGWTISSSVDGVDTIQNVERIKFADATVALDTEGVGGQAYRIYQAAFNRTPDLGGLGFWISVMDGGASLKGVAGGFVESAEFKAVYGASPTNAEIVTRLYDNVLHRPGETGGYNFWLGILDRHDGTVAEVLAAFSESAENQAGVIGVIGNGFAYTPFG